MSISGLWDDSKYLFLFHFKNLDIVKLTLFGVEIKMFFQCSLGGRACDISFRSAKNIWRLSILNAVFPSVIGSCSQETNCMGNLRSELKDGNLCSVFSLPDHSCFPPSPLSFFSLKCSLRATAWVSSAHDAYDEAATPNGTVCRWGLWEVIGLDEVLSVAPSYRISALITGRLQWAPPHSPDVSTTWEGGHL